MLPGLFFKATGTDLPQSPPVGRINTCLQLGCQEERCTVHLGLTGMQELERGIRQHSPDHRWQKALYVCVPGREGAEALLLLLLLPAKCPFSVQESGSDDTSLAADSSITLLFPWSRAGWARGRSMWKQRRVRAEAQIKSPKHPARASSVRQGGGQKSRSGAHGFSLSAGAEFTPKKISVHQKPPASSSPSNLIRFVQTCSCCRQKFNLFFFCRFPFL